MKQSSSQQGSNTANTPRQHSNLLTIIYIADDLMIVRFPFGRKSLFNGSRHQIKIKSKDFVKRKDSKKFDIF